MNHHHPGGIVPYPHEQAVEPFPSHIAVGDAAVNLCKRTVSSTGILVGEELTLSGNEPAC